MNSTFQKLLYAAENPHTATYKSSIHFPQTHNIDLRKKDFLKRLQSILS